MPTIILNLPPHGATTKQVVEIEATLPGHHVLVTQDREQMATVLDDVEIAGGWPLGELLEQMPRLRWYQQWFAGADWLARQPGAVTAPFVVTTASGVHPVQVGEHAFALMLGWVRRLHEAVLKQAAHEWKAPPGETLHELYERTLLVIGVGAIGARIAHLGAALGMRVLAVRKNAAGTVPGVEAVYSSDRLREVLPRADYVVLAAPLNAETRGMIGPEEFRAMKDTAFLVNVGRGGLVQEDALVHALREGLIAGAGLDVFDPEPLPASSPLWSMPNVIITAHYAGASPRYYERAMDVFLDNLRRYRNGLPLRNFVDKSTLD